MDMLELMNYKLQAEIQILTNQVSDLEFENLLLKQFMDEAKI
jgi:hypothetical protein